MRSLEIATVRPNETQRLAKARFWEKVAAMPLVDTNSVSAQRVATIAGDQEVVAWLRDKAFSEWFFNKNTTKQLIEAGVEIAVRRLVEILQDPEVGPKGSVTAASQVNAAKILMEYGGYKPATTVAATTGDKEIDAMDVTDLQQFIAANTPKLAEVK